MNCPKCPQGRLAPTDIRLFARQDGDGVTGLLEVDRCELCGGVWFDAKELDAYLRERLTLVDGPAASRAVDRAVGRCPRCAVDMEKGAPRLLVPVMADYCPLCLGVWLDGGELDQLEAGEAPLAQRLVGFVSGLLGRDRWSVRLK